MIMYFIVDNSLSKTALSCIILYTMIIYNSVLVPKVKEKIKKLISARGISIYDLAQKADLTEACIRNWFTVRNYTPSLEALEKISKAFDISPFELLCDDDEIMPATPENKEFLSKFNLLTKEQKDALLNLLDRFEK